MLRLVRVWSILIVLLVLAGPVSAASPDINRRASQAGEWRVGLQVGHWRSHELPEELARLRTSTGAVGGGYREYEVSLEIAQRTAGYLRGAGVAVDILPATVPPSYRADAFVSLHSDGSSNTGLSGFKLAANWREWEASLALGSAMRSAYAAASGLGWDEAHITSNMRGYYALSVGRFRHTISNYTPGIILEMGYLTNARDRRLMVQGADRLGRGIANGILSFLRGKPAGGWPAPPPLPEYRAVVVTATANVRSGPGTNYPVVRVVQRNRMLLVAEVRGPWLKLLRFRDPSSERWVHRDTVRLERIQDEPPQDS